MATESFPQVPKHYELIWPTLKALRAMGGSASNEELLAKVIELENIPETVQSFIHTDNRRTKLDYNLAWAKIFLKKVGAIHNSTRGVWSITEIGEGMTEADAAQVNAIVRQKDYERRKRGTWAEENDNSQQLESHDDVLMHWKDKLLQVLREMTAEAFERLAQRLLREAGFIKVEVTGRTGDGGIDGLGVLKVNLLSFQVLFQCKRYKGTVGASAVRDFRGAMVGRTDKGLFITTGTFSTDAKQEATRDGAPAIDLIDGEQLCDLLKELGLGIRTEVVERVVVDGDWFAKV